MILKKILCFLFTAIHTISFAMEEQRDDLRPLEEKERPQEQLVAPFVPLSPTDPTRHGQYPIFGFQEGPQQLGKKRKAQQSPEEVLSNIINEQHTINSPLRELIRAIPQPTLSMILSGFGDSRTVDELFLKMEGANQKSVEGVYRCLNRACSKSSRRFFCLETLFLHTAADHVLKIGLSSKQCDKCSSFFSRPDHKCQPQAQNTACDLCGIVFDDRGVWIDHLKILHTKQVETANKVKFQYSCPCPLKPTFQIKNIKKHFDAVHGILVADIPLAVSPQPLGGPGLETKRARATGLPAILTASMVSPSDRNLGPPVKYNWGRRALKLRKWGESIVRRETPELHQLESAVDNSSQPKAVTTDSAAEILHGSDLFGSTFLDQPLIKDPDLGKDEAEESFGEFQWESWLDVKDGEFDSQPFYLLNGGGDLPNMNDQDRNS